MSRFTTVAVTAATLWSGVMGPPASAAVAEVLGRVTFSAPAACAMSFTKTYANGPAVRVGSVAFSLDGGRDKTAVPTFTKKEATITWTASIAPGAYVYDAYMWAAEQGSDDKGVCSGSGLVVVLPGDSIRTKLDVETPGYALDDLYWPAIVYGRAPADVRLSFLTIDGRPPCGSPFLDPASPAGAPERDAVGYWAELFQPFKRAAPLLALRLEQGSNVRFIRLATDFPRASMGMTVSLRYDVTPERAQAAFAGSPGVLLCL